MRQLEDGQADDSFGENGIVFINISKLIGAKEEVRYQLVTSGSRNDADLTTLEEGGANRFFLFLPSRRQDCFGQHDCVCL